MASCASSVRAARVASKLKLSVGDGRGLWVIVDVAVGGSVRVGEETAGDVAVTESVSEVGRPEVSV